MRYVKKFNHKSLPFMYSYRRCPFAMRARLALFVANIKYDIQEISLKNKPRHMIDISPKATVPILILDENYFFEESLEIMLWAFDSTGLNEVFIPNSISTNISKGIEKNDLFFKNNLDIYKYSNDELKKNTAFKNCLLFYEELESSITGGSFLYSSESATMADYSIFPFIRQFINVDPKRLEFNNKNKLTTWFNMINNSVEFRSIMMKPDPLLTE